jgi:hypothetical protein
VASTWCGVNTSTVIAEANGYGITDENTDVYNRRTAAKHSLDHDSRVSHLVRAGL